MKVEAEPNDIKDTGNRSRGCPRQPEDVKNHWSATYSALILPHIVREVNEGPDFAALRRVYLSRIAAEWIRQRTEVDETGFEHVIDSGDVSRWTSNRLRDPNDIFEHYSRWYDDVSSCIRRGSACGRDEQFRVHSGGVDFGKVAQQTVSEAEFKAKWSRIQSSHAYVKGAALAQPKDIADLPPVKPPPEPPGAWTLIKELAGSDRSLGIGLLIVGGLALLVVWAMGDRRRPAKPKDGTR